METLFTTAEIRAVRELILCVLAVLAGFGIGYGLGSTRKEKAA